jgi:hypothetical protein
VSRKEKQVLVALLGIAIAALISVLTTWRIRTSAGQALTSHPPITAASISTIEAAFIRGGAAAVAQVRAAAEQCGRRLPDSPVDAIERDLRARGFLFEPAVVRQTSRIRRVAVVLAIGAASAVLAAHGARLAQLHPAALAAVVAGVFAIGANVIGAVARFGRATPRGRAALAMRRYAYPAALVADADPIEAIALYGGSLRRREGAGVSDIAGSSDGDSSYVWSGGDGYAHGGHGDSGHGHADGGHGCGASSCGSAGCGSH